VNYSIDKLKNFIRAWQVKLLDSDRYALRPDEIEIIREQLKPVLAGIFGYYSLLYSSKAKILVQDNLSIRNSFIIDERKNDLIRGLNEDFRCHYAELPVSSDSIDLIVIPEVLQYDHFPHQILREVERVLIPEGKIIILVENSFSWLNIKKRIQAFIADPHLKTRVISRSRLSDWFRLLGLEISKELPVYPVKDSISKAFLGWNKKWNTVKTIFFSNYFIIVAEKKVSTLTPIRSSWRRDRKLVRPRLAEPSVRVPVEKCMHQIWYKD